MPPVHRPPARLSRDVGSRAHAAVQCWIESGEWLVDTKGQTLLSRFLNGSDHQDATSARKRLTASRLRFRVQDFRHYLVGGTPQAASCEITLRDGDLQLWGRPDIVLSGSDGVRLVDLKTGEWETPGDRLSRKDLRQLMLYAHLVRVSSGVLPVSAAVFSLKRGLLVTPVTKDLVSEVVDEVVAARKRWEGREREPRPSAENCKFCPVRLTCDASWHALPTWSEPDGVEGRIVRIADATAGGGALLVETAWGRSWVVEIAPAILRRAAVDDTVRILGIRKGLNAGARTTFVAGPTATLHVID
ncbi:PD-(D/E)XK nuclease family protein [Rhodococcus jostii]|uniref:PD-(D/E)XK nuclease family protein n=1 Tax=Rhodococcus jostii TaxID=132919 RepID=A0ABU4CE07_RHOJO|nr:PD-(D/E)XK nuclease family protein [Rhodococcus jostii]MDV6281498.1 PD-(D/E)XK nuclease family protein [Rhodococcus jostii]